ncbi:MAG TPA: replication factor C small subunit [Thermoplasmata archaeon]|nr:replication factor C small subunit [Thermoplasmata archaeon]
MKEIWTEKYRPLTLDEVVGQTEIVDRLKAYVASNELPHLLFAGPAGTGKTTCGICLARAFFGEGWSGNFHEQNASDERGIDVVRGKIKDFARTSPLGDYAFKIIFLDEADALTSEAQAALRRTMERFSRCRFIFSVNFSSKIIEPLQSRCAVFRFKPLRSEEVKKYVERVAKNEGIEITSEGMKALTYIARGDLRKATNLLQVGAAKEGKLTEETLYKLSSYPDPKLVRALIEQALEGNFIRARNLLDQLLIDYGLSGEGVIDQIHGAIFNLSLSDDALVEALSGIGEVAFRIIEGSNPRIQLDALLAKFTQIGKKVRGKNEGMHGRNF